jgi:hypothetical protein
MGYELPRPEMQCEGERQTSPRTVTRNVVLWQEWVQFGMECFSDGLSITHSHSI